MLKTKDKEKFVELRNPDLYCHETWQNAAERLDHRLKEAVARQAAAGCKASNATPSPDRQESPPAPSAAGSARSAVQTLKASNDADDAAKSAPKAVQAPAAPKSRKPSKDSPKAPATSKSPKHSATSEAVQAPSAPKFAKDSPKTQTVKAPVAPPKSFNEIPFPVRKGFSPASLRDEMHADPKVFDFTVDGEAAWRCLEQRAITLDKHTKKQQVVCAARKARGPLSDAARRARKTRLCQYFLRNYRTVRLVKTPWGDCTW